MATEIERKFLVHGGEWRQGVPTRFLQGYLNRDKERTVRVWIAGNRAYLTIKGLTKGISRPEFEFEIPLRDRVLFCVTASNKAVTSVRTPYGNMVPDHVTRKTRLRSR